MTSNTIPADEQRAYRKRVSSEARRRKLLWRHHGVKDGPKDAGSIGWSQPPTRVLTAWHVDETGCRARVVGCD